MQTTFEIPFRDNQMRDNQLMFCATLRHLSEQSLDALAFAVLNWKMAVEDG